MSRICSRSVRAASAGMALVVGALLLSGCADAAEPLGGAPPSTVPVSTRTPEGVVVSNPELASGLDAVFARPSGAIDRHVRATYGELRADAYVELRWDTEGGTLRRWADVDPAIREAPLGRRLLEVFRLVDDEEDRRLEPSELPEALAEARASMAVLFAYFDMVDEGGGHWRALAPGGNGQVAATVQLVDGMVEQVTLGGVGWDASAADVWDVVG